MKYTTHEMDIVSEKLSLLKRSAPDGLTYRVDMDRIFNARPGGLESVITSPIFKYSLLLAFFAITVWTAPKVLLFEQLEIELYPLQGKELVYTSLPGQTAEMNEPIMVSKNTIINVKESSGAMLKIEGESALMLKGPSRLSVKECYINKVTGKPTYSFHLKEGRLLASLTGSSGERKLVVNTEHMRAEAKGTIFMVETGEYESSISVYKGVVSILNKDIYFNRSQMLSSGMKAFISDRGMKTRAIPELENMVMTREARMINDPSWLEKSYLVESIEEPAGLIRLRAFLGRIEYWIED